MIDVEELLLRRDRREALDQAIAGSEMSMLLRARYGVAGERREHQEGRTGTMAPSRTLVRVPIGREERRLGRWA